MEELDQRRKDEFKRYEMQMEHVRRQKLKEMNEKQRLEAENKYQQQQEEMKRHEKLKHPASKEQLEDVWENEDGFNKDAFNAKTFFHLHGEYVSVHLRVCAPPSCVCVCAPPSCVCVCTSIVCVCVCVHLHRVCVCICFLQIKTEINVLTLSN